MNLSVLKKKSLKEKVIEKRDLINSYKSAQDLDLENFNKDFKNLSAVWKIFLLHIIKPSKFPVYDQHIHRAYNFINGENFNFNFQKCHVQVINATGQVDFNFSIGLM